MKKPIKRKKPMSRKTANGNRFIIVPEPPPPPHVHRDYRIVLNDVWMQALALRKVTIEERDEFENLTNSENPVACLIRALGLCETTYYEKKGGHIAEDGIGGTWLEMWQQVRIMLSTDSRGRLDGQTLYNCMVAMAMNAGFKRIDFE